MWDRRIFVLSSSPERCSRWKSSTAHCPPTACERPVSALAISDYVRGNLAKAAIIHQVDQGFQHLLRPERDRCAVRTRLRLTSARFRRILRSPAPKLLREA